MDHRSRLRSVSCVAICALAIAATGTQAQPKNPIWVESSAKQGIWQLHAGDRIHVVGLTHEVSPGKTFAWGGALDAGGNVSTVFKADYVSVDNVGMFIVMNKGVADKATRNAFAKTAVEFSKKPDWNERAGSYRADAILIALFSSGFVTKLQAQQLRLPVPPTTLNMDVSDVLNPIDLPFVFHFELKGTQLLVSGKGS